MHIRHGHDAAPKAPGAVLVVDDEAIIRSMLADELRDAGFAVIECSSADEALLVLELGEPISLLLSDIRMPGPIDGVGLARLVRQDYPDLKIVLSSSHLPDGEVHCDIFFAKPYRIAELIETVKTLI